MRAPNNAEPVADVFLINFIQAQGNPEQGWDSFVDVIGLYHLSQPGPFPSPRAAIEGHMSRLVGTPTHPRAFDRPQDHAGWNPYRDLA